MSALGAAILIFSIVGAIILLVFMAGLVPAIGQKRSDFSRANKKELIEARALIKSIERTCIEYRDDSPNLTDIIRSEIDNHNLKELNS